MTNRKALAVGLIVVAVGWLAFVALYMYSGLSAGKLQDVSAFILGVGLFGLMPATVLIAGALVILIQNRAQDLLDRDARFQDRILEAVQTRGQCRFDVLARESGVSEERIGQAVQALVGLGLFTGYVNWPEKEITALEAAALTAEACPNCGGKTEPAGKGVAQCPYCGATTYLPEDQ